MTYSDYDYRLRLNIHCIKNTINTYLNNRIITHCTNRNMKWKYFILIKTIVFQKCNSLDLNVLPRTDTDSISIYLCVPCTYILCTCTYVVCLTDLEWHRLLNQADTFQGMFHHVQPFTLVSFLFTYIFISFSKITYFTQSITYTLQHLYNVIRFLFNTNYIIYFIIYKFALLCNHSDCKSAARITKLKKITLLLNNNYK